ncbi:hypothetical protein NUU61_005153 [Penicillium alfredii]|uniref:Uncharacterized protein n=1 Tax=Penicillium alfredii TaxID=1506179 RepID=A0A9W9F9A8_9EURO|nr:uncharacterized protein NUU61_005153 [Penicillium alfredii]KAJ5095797.1 hypothetical protein NUU61_005153 [Penicillium alfredii]
MPDEPRRVVLEKSRTVRRRYQRSNKPFQFTASQLQRIEREQERERRAKQIRDKEKKRTANKKRKAEEEARVREERKRRGIPDPHAPSVPSSQPLLSNFLGLAKRPAPVAAEPLPTETGDQGDGGDTEPDSEAGDTEVDDDTCDNVEENSGQELSGLQDAGVLENSKSPDSTRKNQCVPKDDDEFSDCSAFNDEDIMKEAEAAATSQPLHETTNHPTPRPSSFLQPPSNSRPKGTASAMVSFGDSFRDETADLLEEAFAGSYGDSFGPLDLPR